MTKVGAPPHFTGCIVPGESGPFAPALGIRVNESVPDGALP